MEELHRLHKDVPFGWWLLLQQALSRRTHVPAPGPAAGPERPAYRGQAVRQLPAPR